MEPENPEPATSQWDMITSRLDAGDQRFSTLERKIDDNTAETNRVKTDTGELLDILNSWKGAFKVFNWIGKAAGPLAGIISLGAAIWGVISSVKGGK